LWKNVRSLRLESVDQMSKKMLQPVLVFAIGAIAIVIVVAASSAFMSSIIVGPSALPFSILVYGATYLFFGLTVGLFWRSKSIYGGLWLVSPLFLITALSIAFAGFVSKFVSHDLPILVSALLTGVIGCHLGQRLTSGRTTAGHAGQG